MLQQHVQQHVNIRHPVATWLVSMYAAKGLHVFLVQLSNVAVLLCVQALKL